MKMKTNHFFSLAIATFLAGSHLISQSVLAADIVATAVSAGKFKTLAAALQAADLVSTLQGKGPFTVFAPTDEAFAKLPPGTVDTLLKPENKSALAAVLTYHVVPGKVMAAQVVGLRGATTVNGQRADIAVDGDQVLVDGAKVVQTDIACDNGVIHVIDAVILPADKTIPATAESAEIFSTLLAAVKAAGLAETLSGPGPFTVFAPTDEAFAKLPPGTVDSLLKPENKQKLVDILKYHVVAGRVYSEGALQAKSAKTLLGPAVQIAATQDGAKVNTASLVKTDLDASNGVIHVIDAVLLPPTQGADARRMLEQAVASGAAMYNAGDHAGCASVYEQTMETLMSTDLSSPMKQHISTVLTSARHQHCSKSRAWTLRTGIDQMYTQLSRTR